MGDVMTLDCVVVALVLSLICSPITRFLIHNSIYFHRILSLKIAIDSAAFQVQFDIELLLTSKLIESSTKNLDCGLQINESINAITQSNAVLSPTIKSHTLVVQTVLTGFIIRSMCVVFKIRSIYS